MDKKFHSMWIYCILVVCVAILLIVISVISEVQVTPTVSFQETAEEIDFTANISQSISQLMENNGKLEEEVAAKTNEIQILNDKILKYEIVLAAKTLYDAGETEQAKEKLNGLTVDGLSPEAVDIYNTVMEIETVE